MVDCKTDFDCKGNLLCYTGNEPWVDISKKNVSFCDCSTWYGFIENDGENCYKFGPTTYFSVTMASIDIFIVLCCLLLNGIDIYLIRRYNLVWKNPALLSMFFEIIAIIALITTDSVRIYLHFDGVNIKILGPGGEKYGKGFLVERTGLTFFVTFLLASLLVISTVWLNLALNVLHMRTSKSRQTVSTQWKKIVLALLISLFGGTIILSAIGVSAFISLYSLLYVFVIIFLFGFTYYKITKAIGNTLARAQPKENNVRDSSRSITGDGSDNANKKIQYVAYWIRRTALGEVFLLSLNVMLLCMYTYFNLIDWKSFSPLNKKLPYGVGLLPPIITFVNSLILFVVAQYIHSIFSSSEKIQTNDVNNNAKDSSSKSVSDKKNLSMRQQTSPISGIIIPAAI